MDNRKPGQIYNNESLHVSWYPANQLNGLTFYFRSFHHIFLRIQNSSNMFANVLLGCLVWIGYVQSLWNGWWDNWMSIHMQKNEVGPLPHTTYFQRQWYLVFSYLRTADWQFLAFRFCGEILILLAFKRLNRPLLKCLEPLKSKNHEQYINGHYVINKGKRKEWSVGASEGEREKEEGREEVREWERNILFPLNMHFSQW